MHFFTFPMKLLGLYASLSLPSLELRTAANQFPSIHIWTFLCFLCKYPGSFNYLTFFMIYLQQVILQMIWYITNTITCLYLNTNIRVLCTFRIVIWSIRVAVLDVILVGWIIVGIKLLVKSVFTYSTVDLFSSHLVKSMIITPAMMLAYFRFSRLLITMSICYLNSSICWLGCLYSSYNIFVCILNNLEPYIFDIVCS